MLYKWWVETLYFEDDIYFEDEMFMPIYVIAFSSILELLGWK